MDNITSVVRSILISYCRIYAIDRLPINRNVQMHYINDGSSNGLYVSNKKVT